MSRPLLSLYRLDRDKLQEISAELRSHLANDDRAALAAMLGLGEELARRIATDSPAVRMMLRADDDPQATAIFASLRRVVKRAALEHVWSSESPALEGRLRAYDVLREEEDIAATIDRFLDGARLPWFLQRPGATGGWLPDDEREDLARRMEQLGPALPDEINAFVEALGGMDGAALVHDRL